MINRRDLRIFFNRTRGMWTIEVVAPFDSEVVEERHEVKEVEIGVPSYCEVDKGGRSIIKTFGCVRLEASRGIATIYSI